MIVASQFVIARSQSAKLLQSLKATLNVCPRLIQVRVIASLDPARGLRRNHGLSATLRNHLQDRLGIIGFVGQHRADAPQIGQQGGRLGHIGYLAAGENELDGIPQGINQRMNLGGEAAS